MTTFVLVLCLSLLSLLSLWRGETEVTLAALGAILSLLSPRPPKPPHPEADWLGLSGYTLMLAGGIGSLYKVLVG